MAQYKKIGGGSSEHSSAAKASCYYKEEHLEIDLYQREADLRHRQLTCTKNPGHESLMNIKEVALEDLPECLKHQEVLDYILAVSNLVVRVKVNRTSEARPKDDPFHSFIGRAVMRGATGCVTRAVDINNIQEFPCTDGTCIQACEHSVFGFIDIRTNKHVVFDSLEARETEAEFFYDSSNRMNVVSVRGLSTMKDPSDDECVIIRCVTHDVDFVRKVHRLVERALEAGASISRSIREQSLIDYAIILSHPHGSVKSLSIGGLSEYKKVPNNAGLLKRLFRQMTGKQRLRLRVTTYLSATCPGCTGAPVITGYDEGWGWWCLTHSTADLTSGVNMAFNS